MAHIIKYTKLVAAGEIDQSAEGVAVYNAYEADGRVTFHEEVVGDNVYGYLRFVDEATADSYVAELTAIEAEHDFAHQRADIARYDEA